jgi:hypothetical protein
MKPKEFMKMATKRPTSKVKITKVTKNARVDAEPKKAKDKATPATPTDSTQITFKQAREKTGPKTKLLALVPRKGTITCKELAAKADAEGIKAARVPKFVASLARYGFVELA